MDGCAIRTMFDNINFVAKVVVRHWATRMFVDIIRTPITKNKTAEFLSVDIVSSPDVRC